MNKRFEDAQERRNENHHAGDGKQNLSMEGNRHERHSDKATATDAISPIEKHIMIKGAGTVDDFVANSLRQKFASGDISGMQKFLSDIATEMEKHPENREHLWQGLKRFDNEMAKRGIEVKVGVESADADHKHIDKMSICMHAPGHPDGVEIKVTRQGQSFKQSTSCYDWESKGDNYSDPKRTVDEFNKGNFPSSSMKDEVKKIIDEKGDQDGFSASMDENNAHRQISVILNYAYLHGYKGRTGEAAIQSLQRDSNDYLAANRSRFKIAVGDDRLDIITRKNEGRHTAGYSRPTGD